MKNIILVWTILFPMFLAVEGYSEMQEVTINGVTRVKAYKMRNDENKEDQLTGQTSVLHTPSTNYIETPSMPQCSAPAYDGELPFPMAVVTINGLFVPVRGKARWLPPDPQDAGKKTIEGIDSDNDCVRDDIEIFIAQKYPDFNQQKVRKFLFDYAKFLGLFLQQGLSRETAQYYSKSMFISLECARRELGDTPNTSKSLDEIFAKFHNTIPRSYKYIENNSLLGGTNSEIPATINCNYTGDPIVN